MKFINHCKQFWITGSAAFCGILFLAVLPVCATETPGNAAVPAPVPRSVFTQPSSPKEGRDPFFPSSIRPYASAMISQTNTNTTDLSSLVMVGMSGTPEHPLVIINNVTFAVGDDREVQTPKGRIDIRCLQIVGDLAVVEANGERHELRYGVKP